MQELKLKSICEKCEHFSSTQTKIGFPIFRCEIEDRKYHKLSTVLYSEPPEDCPYYTEHFVMKMNEEDFYSLRNSHARLGYGKD